MTTTRVPPPGMVFQGAFTQPVPRCPVYRSNSSYGYVWSLSGTDESMRCAFHDGHERQGLRHMAQEEVDREARLYRYQAPRETDGASATTVALDAVGNPCHGVDLTSGGIAYDVEEFIPAIDEDADQIPEPVDYELGGISSVLQAEQIDSVIDHPAHYGGDTAYEAIKVIEAWGLGFSLGNAVKYIARAGRKDPAKTLEDLEKAAWYLQRHIDSLRKGT